MNGATGRGLLFQLGTVTGVAERRAAGASVANAQIQGADHMAGRWLRSPTSFRIIVGDRSAHRLEFSGVPTSFDTPDGTRGGGQPKGALLRWGNWFAARRISRTGRVPGLGFNAL